MSAPSQSRAFPAIPTNEAEYQNLLGETIEVAEGFGIDPDQRDATLILFDKLHVVHAPTAEESLVVAHVAIAMGETIQEFYDKPEVSLPYIWSVSLLHDIGKIGLPDGLLDKSQAGIEWTDADAEAMCAHSGLGGQIVLDAGLSSGVERPIEENHGRQISRLCYGVNPVLTLEERITRDCVAVSDFGVAALSRTNSRNRGMPIEARLGECRADAELVFGDYERAQDLVALIQSDVIERIPTN